MEQDDKKLKVARAALDYIEDDMVLGVGTGSTVNFFIDELARSHRSIDSAVASSVDTEQRLREHGIRTTDLNSCGDLELYIDGADEATKHLHLIKGGGGALTREKIIAAASRKFICIIDDSKLVDRLGSFPLPVEIIPMARSYVSRELAKLGGQPVLREGFITDNGNCIVDVHNLDISNPVDLEQQIDGITGVVTNGLFARRHADAVLVSTGTVVNRLT